MNHSKRPVKSICSALAATALLLLTACQPSQYVVTHTASSYLAVDSTLDGRTSQAAMAFIAPYQAHVDSVMNKKVGATSVAMDRFRPESPLSNLVADVLRQSAGQVLGHEADMGLVNMGGIRSSLPLGDLTIANIFEILPFENSLCVLTMKGKYMLQLCHEIAGIKGEGVSGIRLRINEKGELLEALVGGKPIEEEKTYTLATLDYLADGNDRMTACLQAEKRECPAGMTVRKIFMDYTMSQAAAGKKLEAKIEGRIVIEK